MRLALLAAALLAPAVAAAQTTVYSQNFETGPLGAEWSGAGSIQTTGGLSAFGFGANHLRNDVTSASVLSLSGLAAHTTMTLAFDLAMWDSIDFGDTFQVFLGGTPLFNASFGNYGTQSGQCEGPGTRTSEAFTDAFSTPNYGVNAGFRDCSRAVTFTFAHSATSAVFSFAYPNTQGGTDESFGLDNVVVRTNAAATSTTAPEPGTWLLLGTGLVALGCDAAAPALRLTDQRASRGIGSTPNSRAASAS